MIHEQVRTWDVDELAVGCSGNYTIERCVADLNVQLHSNDVQIYSAALGWFLAGEELPITLKPEVEEALPWLADYMDGRAGTLATIMLGSGMTSFLKAVKKPDNAYYQRILRGIERQFPTMHAKTVEKLQGITMHLASFHAMDVGEWVNTKISRDIPVCCFPPFFAGDYESQFKILDDSFDWPKPDYPELDQEGVDALIDDITDRKHWVLGLHIRREHLQDQLRGIVQTSNRGVPIYIYASGGKSRVVRPRQSTEIVPARRLGPGDRLGERLSLATLTTGQFATLRSQYMNHKIKPGSPYLPLAVLVDGILVGATAVGPSTNHPTTAYMLSDFPVDPTDYERLAKLILYAALSRESRLLLQRRCGTVMERLRTTAFTDRPVSMKYRGVFKLEKRAESPDPEYQNLLNYIADYGQWSLAEGFEMWKKKHGKLKKGVTASGTVRAAAMSTGSAGARSA